LMAIRFCGRKHMTQRATTSLSLHYQVKPGQKEQVLDSGAEALP
jgi:hypothetical protein